MKRQLEELIEKKYLEEILATERDYIELNFENMGELGLRESKIGGFGYLPDNIYYPKNNMGQPLSLLVQINFNKLPSLEKYPDRGILSIYVDHNSRSYGIDFEKPNNQNGFRVLYFPDIGGREIPLVEQVREFNKVDIKKYHPVTRGELKISGVRKKQYLISENIEANLIYGMTWEEKLEEISGGNKRKKEKISRLARENVNQIGGYPVFNQWDPRNNLLDTNYNSLLIQLGNFSIGDNKFIDWGRAGIGNFFMDIEAMANENFIDVLYNWDCR